MKSSAKNSVLPSMVNPLSQRRHTAAGGWTTFVLVALFVFTAVPVPALAGSRVDVIKSENDQRRYEYVRLENQLQVLLISDPETDKAAAALDMYVGSGADPQDRQGLAHFLEHMLFLGTKKYPQPGEYQEYISAHGGTHNAYTSLEHTNYFFDIEASYLEPTLDRFAQFFISPLFTGKYVDRERHAVHSEYKAKIKDDFRRSLDVLRQVVNPQHPLAKFSVGSLDTLADREQDPVRDDLLAFYRRHYTASRMTLVVLGKEPLSALKAMVSSRFSKVAGATAGKAPEKPQSAPAEQPMFAKGLLPSKLFIKPVQEIRHLSFSFPLPRADLYYREKPLQYIGNLVGHEGEGSLLSLLKRKGWAEGLSAGEGLSGREGAVFDISISLTPEGVKQQAKVEALVFKTIELIQRQGLDRWRFEEQRQLADIAFRFQEKAEPMQTVSALANRMHYFEPKDILRGSHLFAHYDKKLIKRFLSDLRPDNVLITLEAQSVATDRVTDMYQTPYRVEKLTPALAAVEPDLVAELALPEKNPFIPRRLELKAVANSIDTNTADKNTNDKTVPVALPRQLIASTGFRAYFKQDDQFSVPRGNLFLRVKSPAAAQSADTAALTELYVRMVNDSLNEFAYPALLAGLQFSVDANTRGLDIRVGGYNDKQKVLLERILGVITDPDFNAERFANLQQEVIRQWRNISKQPPYQQLLREMPAAIFQPYWERNKLIAALENKTLKDLDQFSRKLFVNSDIDLLIYGNYDRKEAHKLAMRVQSELVQSGAGEKSPLPQARVIKLPEKGKGLYTPVEADHQDAAVTLYLQGRDDSVEDMAHMMVLQQVLKAPFFHELRTEKQLGYVVFVTGMPFKEVPGTALVVQSPVASVQRLINEINGFAKRFGKELPTDLTQHKQAVMANLKEQPKNQFEQAQRYWDNIVHDVKSFDRREQLAAAVADVTQKSFADYYQQVMQNPARQWWWVAGEFDSGKEGLTPVVEFDTFKPVQPAFVYP